MTLIMPSVIIISIFTNRLMDHCTIDARLMDHCTIIEDNLSVNPLPTIRNS